MGICARQGNGNGFIAAGRSVLAMEGGAWACAIAGMSGSAFPRKGAEIAGIVVRNCPIGVRLLSDSAEKPTDTSLEDAWASALSAARHLV